MPLQSPRGSLEDGASLRSPTESAFTTTGLPPTTKKKPWVLLVVLALFLVAVIDVGAFLAEPPKTRVYEANICLSYYREHDTSAIGPDGAIPEKLCKIDAVQQKLAMIFGWQETFDAIPAVLLAVPFGTLADRVGRKWIFTASLMGLQLNSAWILLICYFKTLPLQWTWLSSAFFVIGGGPLVSVALALSMIADIAPPEKRTTIFLYLTASVLVAEMCAPLMAAKLMDRGDWLPLLLALGIQQVGICIAFFFPETLHLRDLPEPRDNVDHSIELEPIKGGHFTLRAQLRNFRIAYTFLRSDFQLGLVVFSFMANRLGRQAMTLLVRYASKRYEWQIKDAAYLLSFRAAANLVAVAVFLPLVNWYLLKYLRIPAHWADLWIARASIILTMISFFIMGIAAYPALLVIGLLVYNLGTGYNAAMRSVAIHVIGGQASPDVGKLMSTIAIVEAIGAMIAGPLLNQMFQWGMDLGSTWLGLPFLASVLVLAVMTVLTFMISVKDREVGYVQVHAEDDSEDELGRTSALEDGPDPRRILQNTHLSLDPDVAKQQALAAATAAFTRAQAQDAADLRRHGGYEVTRSKSNASRKSTKMHGQGSHFPARGSSFRSSYAQDEQASTREHKRGSDKFPPPISTSAMKRPISAPRPLSTQPSVSFSDMSRPSTQPKPGRSGASMSASSQQIRKARSMYYASSVQTGSPMARPPTMYMATPPVASAKPTLEVPPSARTVGPSPLSEPRIPVIVAEYESVDKARDTYLQSFQQRSVKHKPSLFLAPFIKRQDRGIEKSKHLLSGGSLVTTDNATPAESTTDVTLYDFMPPVEKKDRRSFSGSLKSKIKRVFRRSSKASPSLPVQQIQASREYFGTDFVDTDRASGSYAIPSPDDDMLQRVRAPTMDTLTHRAMKRMTVIHESKDSIGSETERTASLNTKRKSLSSAGLAAFRDPMPMKCLLEESSTPVDPKRVFSALMREIRTSASPERVPNQIALTPGAESDVFESSKTKISHVGVVRPDASKGLHLSKSIDQPPPSRRPPSATAQSTQSKSSSIRSLGRAIRSTIRTVTPVEQRSSPCPERRLSVCGTVRIPRNDVQESSAATTPANDEDCIDVHTSQQTVTPEIFSPSPAQIEKRVERARDRWKTPLDDVEQVQFPRETDRTYNVANLAHQTFTHHRRHMSLDQVELLRTDIPAPSEPPVSPSVRRIMSPLSPSIYSRNTDGASILPNDSATSLDMPNDLERHHNGGSAVVLTSQSVRSYVVGTPSPCRADSTRSSRDWKTWLSHEVFSMEFTSQENLMIDERYLTPPKKHYSDDVARSSRLSRSPPESISSSLKSSKAGPGPKIYSDLSVPTVQSSQPMSNVALQNDDSQDSSKENVIPLPTSANKGRQRPHISPLGAMSRPKSLQPLSSTALNRRTGNAGQYKSNIPEFKHSKDSSTSATLPLRPHEQASIRLTSPEQLNRRPKSAFDLRAARTAPPRPASEFRRPALNVKASTDSFAMTKEPSPGAEQRFIDSVLEEGNHGGSSTPGQRMADNFLRERKSTGVLLGKMQRSPRMLVREDTPAFL
ncbi:hypothetical protein DE146DRAFT_604896 [Phaeosphaeria sp. MPI-PUGE-AT-0046c]|nr:hypothetical protein DE146DRAFT_604896 [Phaeosphaeria sp. MPI-PUGE-AT-0046c]